MPEITDRHTQAQLGHAHYYTGKPCKRGHVTLRFVGNGGCVDCVNVKRARSYTANNVRMPDKPFVFPAGRIPKGEAIPWAAIFAVLQDWVVPAYEVIEANRRAAAANR